jgi:hypothetical protein
VLIKKTSRRLGLARNTADPPIGLNNRIWLARDFYAWADTVDYSVDPTGS